MALSIKIKTIHYSAQLVINTSIRQSHMLCMLATHDPQGKLLDNCQGNIQVAFSMLLSNKMYLLYQVHIDQSINNLSKLFNLINRQLPLAFTDKNPDWGFKLINIEHIPQLSFQIEEVI